MKREEAIQILRTQYPHDAVIKEALGLLIPELRESEDERIRKGLIEVVSDIAGSWPFEEHKITKKEALAYLEKQKEFSEHGYGLYYYHNGGLTFVGRPAEEEKQKEQKPAEWSEEDEKIRNLAIEWAETMYGQFRFVDMGSTDFRKIVAWLKSIRPQPKQEWSEEDERIMQTMIKEGDLKPSEIAWLKSIRPQSHWKPSEEQMDRLFSIIVALRKDYCDDMADFLASLYKQLKKLM